MAERLFEEDKAPRLSLHRREVVVHVDAEVLARGTSGRCEIKPHTALAAETAMARWHGERIDHAVMVTMHAWSSEGSRPGIALP